ncbi:hypothetical protein GCM10010384_03370 [Streptomyces djakartensis]|uniref:DUF3017 domain-containing protein n=1 Tax=Streptomyces djakartensis TaxID=68193 RepID=A0ABQ2Z411_9ACTN|nr:hypothetical protein GCM10010384_03370 [Streptomyces djakartensis]
MSAERNAAGSARSTAGSQGAPGVGAAQGAQSAEAARGAGNAKAAQATSGAGTAHGGTAQSAPSTPGAAGGEDAPDRHTDADAQEASGELTVRDPVSAPDAEGRPRRVTRRFPLFTKDTARPEGGGRAAPGDAPAPARQWPVLAVLGLVGLGLLVTAFGQFRIGTLMIGVALLGGGALRWLLPDVGMLAVRSRFTDIATYAVMGLVIVMLALMAQPKPWLQLPFLKDTLHFTVTNE